jgi:hypothetical protein
LLSYSLLDYATGYYSEVVFFGSFGHVLESLRGFGVLDAPGSFVGEPHGSL